MARALLDRLRAHRAKLHRAVRVTVAAVGRVFALAFALEQLRENARDLRDRAAELTHVR